MSHNAPLGGGCIKSWLCAFWLGDVLRRRGLWQGSLLGCVCDLRPIETEQAGLNECPLLFFYILTVLSFCFACFSTISSISVPPLLSPTSQSVTAVVLLMNACLMLSSTAAQEVGGAVLAAGKTQLALTVSDAERTSLDHSRSIPAMTATVMQWVSYVHTHTWQQSSCAPVTIMHNFTSIVY